MSYTAIKIDTEIVESAKVYGVAESRSATKQVEYWARVGKIAQDNPDLTFQDITELLLSMAQVKAGNTTPYNFG
ncbi:ParD-like family protein [Acinetobacter sp. A3.8]|uniref:ParD-like family protein n=1 Tax=Acinetobacter sedimenti TaxID=2919922 RepID=A0A9X1WZ64_9GAMM|nr:ParD-like family protein [Acinetobacter sedimenti]MCJ8147148.1 ParD-like family protein [Acinetobacter sedimenti]